jgi:hypothetical protein
VAERSIAPVLKTGVGATRPGVRIPPSPLAFDALSDVPTAPRLATPFFIGTDDCVKTAPIRIAIALSVTLLEAGIECARSARTDAFTVHRILTVAVSASSPFKELGTVAGGYVTAGAEKAESLHLALALVIVQMEIV